jgi:heterodisulfide reductase subunit C
LVTQALKFDQSNPAEAFLHEVDLNTAGESRIDMCIQCGTCGGSCPSAQDMDHTPRALFAMIRAGMRDDVLSSNTPWVCVSCYNCVVRCPQNVKITEIMYALKSMAIREKRYKDAKAPDFSMTFVDMVDQYGRSYEFGLATRHYLKHFPMRLPGMSSMGLGMLSRKRMTMSPRKIQGLDQMQAILAKARELEAQP